MFEQPKPNPEETTARLETFKQGSEFGGSSLEVRHETDEIEALPFPVRSLARVVKLMGQSVKRWLDRGRWEVGYQSIKDMLAQGEEGAVVAFGLNWAAE